MWIIFLKGYCVLVRVEIIHKSKFLPGTVENRRGFAQAWVRFLPEDLVVDEFFSTVPGKNFDLCIISTRTKTQYLYKNMMVWNTKDIVLCFFF